MTRKELRTPYFAGGLIATAPTRKPVTKRFGRNSDTYRLFEALFLELPEEALPWRKALPRGQAINLAMGLNRCHVQWAEDSGVGDEMMLRSARTVEENGEWYLEVGFNTRRSGRSNAAAGRVGSQASLLLAELSEGSLLGPQADQAAPYARELAPCKSVEEVLGENTEAAPDASDELLRAKGYY